MAKKVEPAPSGAVAVSGENKPVQRAQWGNQIEFLMTMVSYAVGIGNIWRFPYLCYRNGGGAFLIPYFIMLLLLGMPMYFLETGLGQYSGQGPTKAWRISPLFRGLGWASVSISGIIGVYYNVLVSYMLYFLVASMRAHVPWISCAAGNGSWASASCTDSSTNLTTAVNSTEGTCINGTIIKSRTPSEDYYYRHVSQQSMGIEYPGTIPWHLAVALFGAWCIVGAVLIKGVQSLGKIVYITAIFPYIMLTTLLINNCLKDGAKDGVLFYLNPDWSKLATLNTWSDAASQIFFSISVAYGGLVAMSSYSNFKNNVYRDTIIVTLINCGTSFYAGFAIFSAMGAMAFQKGVNVSDVATTGPELAFVTYPQALAGMPISTLWSILFFIMMCLLGFGSSFSNIETVITSFMDEFPNVLRKTTLRSVGFRLLTFVFFFLMGLPMITQGGTYLLTLVDDVVGGLPLLVVGMFEAIAIGWVYGYKKFSKNIKEMIGFEPNIYWKFLWVITTPTLLTILVILKIITVIQQPTEYTGFLYGKDCPYKYPKWAQAMAWLIILFPISHIFTGFIYQVTKGIRKTGSIIGGIRQAALPSKGFKSQLERDMQDPSTFDPPIEMKLSPDPRSHGPDIVHAWSVASVVKENGEVEMEQPINEKNMESENDMNDRKRKKEEEAMFF